jgi:hypothetical protein
MMLELYVLLWVSAGYATHLWAVTRDDELIPMAATISIGLWGILAVQSTVQHFDDSGNPTSTSVESLQYAPIALTILSVGALVLWYFGAYPPRHRETYGDEIA